MATPTVAWGVTSQSSAVSSSDAVPVAPAAGDLVFVSITVANESGSPPTVTPASGWEIVDNQTFTVYGAYPSRNVLMKKVIGSSEASNLGSTYTTNANLLITTDAWGIRGADPASMVMGSMLLTSGTSMTFPDISTTVGALVIRLGGNHSPSAGYWAMSGPSGHTRLNNKVTVDPNTGLYYTTATAATTGTAGPVTLGNDGSALNTSVYTISLADSSGPDVTAPTITSSASVSVVEGTALSDTMTANEAVTWTEVGGADAAAFTLTGAVLSLPAQPYPAGPFVVTVRATDAAGNWSEQTRTVSVTEAPPLSFLAAATGTNTATMPPHQAGDLILCWAYRDGSNTLPTLPSAGWTSLNGVTGANTNSGRLVGKIAASSSETVGTFTSATSVEVLVYRPKPGYVASFGAVAAATGASTTVSFPALTLQAGDGSSWVVGLAGHRSVNTGLESPPAGMVNRVTLVDATDEVAAHDTNGGVSSWTAKSVSVGGTSSGWRTATVEIKVTLPGSALPTFQAFIIH